MFQCRSELCVIAALLLLCNTSAWAQQVRHISRSLATSNASWASESKTSRLAEAEFVDALRRHAEVRRYKEAPAAGLKLYHYMAGLKFELPLMGQTRWDLVADFGMGATRLKSSQASSFYTSDQRISEVFVSVLGGVRLRYAIADNFSAFVGAREHFYLEDGDGLVIDGLEDPGRLLRTGSWTFPLTLGVRISF